MQIFWLITATTLQPICLPTISLLFAVQYMTLPLAVGNVEVYDVCVLNQCFSTFFASRTTLCNKKILGNTKKIL